MFWNSVYCAYHQFYHSATLNIAQIVFMGFLRKSVISLNSINQLVFVMEMHSVSMMLEMNFKYYLFERHASEG